MDQFSLITGFWHKGHWFNIEEWSWSVSVSIRIYFAVCVLIGRLLPNWHRECNECICWLTAGLIPNMLTGWNLKGELGDRYRTILESFIHPCNKQFGSLCSVIFIICVCFKAYICSIYVYPGNVDLCNFLIYFYFISLFS